MLLIASNMLVVAHGFQKSLLTTFLMVLGVLRRIFNFECKFEKCSAKYQKCRRNQNLRKRNNFLMSELFQGKKLKKLKVIETP